MSSPGRSASFPAIPLGATVALVGTLGSIYIVSQFLRNSVGVIAPNLAAELGLSASEIGLLSSAFFFAFAGAQIPLGIALDRWGPRRSMLVCSGIAIAGAMLFSVASTTLGLIAARVLMGIGSSCFLMAPLTLYARRYAPGRFAMLTGIQLGLGTVGTLLATAPLAFAAAALGWRGTFLLVAGLVLVAALLVFGMVREDAPDPRAPHRPETFRDNIAGLIEALRTPSVGRLFFMQLFGYSSFVLVVGLWGGPYLTHIYGYDLTARGDMLLLAAIAQIVGVLLWGHADRLLGGHKLPVLVGFVATALALLAVAYAGVLSEPGLMVWLIAVGFASACVTVLIAHGKALFPSRLVGRGMTLLNMGTMAGVFLSQTVSGALIDLFPVKDGAYALDAYRAVFGLQAIFALAACLLYLGARDPGSGRPEP
jgi:MFS family permease